MFANFFHLFSKRPAGDYESAFVREVEVQPKLARNVHVERIIWWAWSLIVLKSVFVWWACTHYPVPFHPLWIVGPTVIFAALCTAVYFWRR
jgi:hypothetical protein